MVMVAEFQETEVPVHSYLGQVMGLEGRPCRAEGHELSGGPKVKGRHLTTSRASLMAGISLDFRNALQCLVVSPFLGWFQVNPTKSFLFLKRCICII